MKITLPLEQITASNTGFVVPDDVVEKLGGGKRPPVLVGLGGQQVRLRITSMGGG